MGTVERVSEKLRHIEYRRRKATEERREYHPRIPAPSGYKRCYSCKGVKPPAEFHKNKSQKDGLASQCKNCKRIDDRKRPRRSHYVPNPRKPRILTTEELERLRERSRDYAKAWYEAKKDMLLSRFKERDRKDSSTLSDKYIKHMVTKRSSLKFKDVPLGLIEAWRLKITLQRELKNQKEAVKCANLRLSTT